MSVAIVVKRISRENLERSKRQFPRGNADTRHAEMMAIIDELDVEQLAEFRVPDDWAKATNDEPPLNPEAV